MFTLPEYALSGANKLFNTLYSNILFTDHSATDDQMYSCIANQIIFLLMYSDNIKTKLSKCNIFCIILKINDFK